VKPITSELGGVSPLIVVPGPWTRADFEYQAESFATQKLLNGGFNCIATQVVILPSDWDGSEQLLGAIKKVVDRLPPRYPYYPGAEERRRAVAAERGSVTVGASPVTWLPDLDCEHDHRAFSEEFFSAAFAVTRLPADDLTSYLEAAVDFANERLEGTLGANLIIHPATVRSLGPRLEQVIGRLRYGAIAINTWTAFNFLQPRGSWGGFPGHTLDRVGSGIGVVHNALLFDRPEKSVARGPFRPMPRSWLRGEFTLSPKPPWFLTSRTGAETARIFTRFGADHSPRHLPALFAAALRG
jgi:aldehyde dehydrogenase (NAD(P)+)